MNVETSPHWVPSHVRITIHQAKDLHLKSKSGHSEVYVSLTVDKEKYTTATLPKQANLHWNEVFVIPLMSLVTSIHITVRQKGRFGDKYIGYISMSPNSFKLGPDTVTHWYKLGPKPGKLSSKLRGDLQVTFQFLSKWSGQEGGGGGESSTDIGSLHKHRGMLRRSLSDLEMTRDSSVESLNKSKQPKTKRELLGSIRRSFRRKKAPAFKACDEDFGSFSSHSAASTPLNTRTFSSHSASSTPLNTRKRTNSSFSSVTGSQVSGNMSDSDTGASSVSQSPLLNQRRLKNGPSADSVRASDCERATPTSAELLREKETAPMSMENKEQNVSASSLGSSEATLTAQTVSSKFHNFKSKKKPWSMQNLMATSPGATTPERHTGLNGTHLEEEEEVEEEKEKAAEEPAVTPFQYRSKPSIIPKSFRELESTTTAAAAASGHDQNENSSDMTPAEGDSSGYSSDRPRPSSMSEESSACNSKEGSKTELNGNSTSAVNGERKKLRRGESMRLPTTTTKTHPYSRRIDITPRSKSPNTQNRPKILPYNKPDQDGPPGRVQSPSRPAMLSRRSTMASIPSGRKLLPATPTRRSIRASPNTPQGKKVIAAAAAAAAAAAGEMSSSSSLSSSSQDKTTSSSSSSPLPGSTTTTTAAAAPSVKNESDEVMTSAATSCITTTAITSITSTSITSSSIISSSSSNSNREQQQEEASRTVDEGETLGSRVCPSPAGSTTSINSNPREDEQGRNKVKHTVQYKKSSPLSGKGFQPVPLLPPSLSDYTTRSHTLPTRGSSSKRRHSDFATAGGGGGGGGERTSGSSPSPTKTRKGYHTPTNMKYTPQELTNHAPSSITPPPSITSSSTSRDEVDSGIAPLGHSAASGKFNGKTPGEIVTNALRNRKPAGGLKKTMILYHESKKQHNGSGSSRDGGRKLLPSTPSESDLNVSVNSDKMRLVETEVLDRASVSAGNSPQLHRRASSRTSSITSVFASLRRTKSQSVNTSSSMNASPSSGGHNSNNNTNHTDSAPNNSNSTILSPTESDRAKKTSAPGLLMRVREASQLTTSSMEQQDNTPKIRVRSPTLTSDDTSSIRTLVDSTECCAVEQRFSPNPAGAASAPSGSSSSHAHVRHTTNSSVESEGFYSATSEDLSLEDLLHQDWEQWTKEEVIKELINCKQKLRSTEDQLADIKKYMDSILLRIIETNPAILSANPS